MVTIPEIDERLRQLAEDIDVDLNTEPHPIDAPIGTYVDYDQFTAADTSAKKLMIRGMLSELRAQLRESRAYRARFVEKMLTTIEERREELNAVNN